MVIRMSVDIPDAKLLGETLAHMAYICVNRNLDRSVIYSCGDQVEIEFSSRMDDNEQQVIVSEVGGKILFTANRNYFVFLDNKLKPTSTVVYNFAKSFANDVISRS